MDRKIVGYSVVIGGEYAPDGLEQFCDDVDSAIKKGAQPYGALVVRTYENGVTEYYQAVVWYEDAPKTP
jgi:hypothetical protein